MSGFRFSAGAGIFSLHHCIQIGSGSYPCEIGTRSSFHRVKQLGHEADHSPPSSADVQYT